MKPWQIALALLLVAAVATIAAFPQVRAKLVNKATTTMQLQTGDWTTVEGAVEILTQTLEAKSEDALATDLYAQMTSDFKDTFDWENFRNSITEARLKVLGAEVLKESDEFAKVKMRLKSQDQEKDFIVYLKKENGTWKLYATEEI